MEAIRHVLTPRLLSGVAVAAVALAVLVLAAPPGPTSVVAIGEPSTYTGPLLRDDRDRALPACPIPEVVPSAVVDGAAEKTALLFPVDAVATGQPAAPAIDAEVKATGRTRDIEGVPCTEFAVMMKVNMAAMAAGAGSSLPPEAAALLKDVFLRVEGSTWVARDAPGATDYAVFQKAAARAAMSALSRVSASGGGSSPGSSSRLIESVRRSTYSRTRI